MLPPALPLVAAASATLHGRMALLMHAKQPPQQRQAAVHPRSQKGWWQGRLD